MPCCASTLQMLPEVHLRLAPALIVLGIVNSFMRLNAFARTTSKRRICLRSVSHMGFVLLGIGAIQQLGMSARCLQMISHGLIAASMFLRHRACSTSAPRPSRSRTWRLQGVAVLCLLPAKLACLPGPAGHERFVSESRMFPVFTSNEGFPPASASSRSAGGDRPGPSHRVLFALDVPARVLWPEDPGVGRSGRHCDRANW